MTGLGGALYIASNSAIYQVDRNGEYQTVGNDTWSSKHLVGVAGVLISIEPGGGMFRLDPATREYRELEGDWSSTIAATAHDGALYVIDRGGALYRVSPGDGSYTQLEGGFASTACLTAAGDALLTIEQSGSMYRVSTADGTWSRLDETWAGARAAAGDATTAYVASGESMFTVDPTDGTYADFTDTTWTTRLLAVAGPALYSLESGGALYRIEL